MPQNLTSLSLDFGGCSKITDASLQQLASHWAEAEEAANISSNSIVERKFDPPYLQFQITKRLLKLMKNSKILTWKKSVKHGRFENSCQKRAEKHGKIPDSYLKTAENHGKFPDSSYQGSQHQVDQSEVPGRIRRHLTVPEKAYGRDLKTAENHR